MHCSCEDRLRRLGITWVDALLVYDLDLLCHETDKRVQEHLIPFSVSSPCDGK